MHDDDGVFAKFAMLGPATFFESFWPEDRDTWFHKLSPEHAREHFVLRTLAEVQKYGFAAERWNEARRRYAAKVPLADIQLESINVEQAAWQRRLLEALVLLINFSTTNEQPFFADYLTLATHDRLRHQGKEERDFFGFTSKLTQLKIEKSEAQVDAAIAMLPPQGARWYADRKNPRSPATLRTQFLRALPLALSSERAALGYTYGTSFGGSSKRLHFSILEGDAQAEDDQISVAFCGLLSIAIVGRAHDLCGIIPTGTNAVFLAEKHQHREEGKRLANVAEVGDFVVVGQPPMLGEVLERRSTAHGYDCYLIDFIDPQNDTPPAPQDWIPAPSLARAIRRVEVIDGLQRFLAEASQQSFSETELLQATRVAVVQMWRLGLKDYLVSKNARHRSSSVKDDLSAATDLDLKPD